MSLVSKKLIINGADFSDINIKPENYILKSITIDTQPTKTSYAVGEVFNPAGMVVMATLEGEISGNIITNIITNYTYTPTTPLIEGSNTITISYTLDDVTKTTTLMVTAVETITYTITTSITNGTASGDTVIGEESTATVTLSANNGYALPSSITVSGASYTYNATTGVVNLNNPTGNVSITAVCIIPVIPVELELGAFTGSGVRTSPTPPIIESDSTSRLRTPNNKKIEVGNGLTITGSDYEAGCGFCVLYYANISDTESPYYEEWGYANPRVVNPNASYPYVRIMVKPYANNRVLNNSMIPTEEARITIYKN